MNELYLTLCENVRYLRDNSSNIDGEFINKFSELCQNLTKMDNAILEPKFSALRDEIGKVQPDFEFPYLMLCEKIGDNNLDILDDNAIKLITLMKCCAMEDYLTHVEYKNIRE